MPSATLRIDGPAEPRVPLLLDSPHSGHDFPADFGAAVSEFDLRDGEDCFVDELYLPATERGVALLAALRRAPTSTSTAMPATSTSRSSKAAHWPDAIGRAARRASARRSSGARSTTAGRSTTACSPVDEVRRPHRPRPPALPRRRCSERIAATHARFGASWHIDCHSMNAVSGAQGEGGAGVRRADFVLGDRDGTSCDPALHRVRRAACSPAWATTSASTTRTRASSWCAPTRTRPQGA